MKYLGINLKNMQNIYRRNYKTLVNEIKEQKNEEIVHAHR